MPPRKVVSAEDKSAVAEKGKNDRMRRLKKAIDEKSMKVLNFQQDNVEEGLKYQILGSTGSIYDVVFDKEHFSCTCPDHARSHSYCKHIYLVYIKIFHLIPDVEAFGNKIHAMQYQMMKLGHERFMEMNKEKIEEMQKKQSENPMEGYRFNKEDECSICFDVFGEARIFGCKTCKNCFHNACMTAIFRINSRCPMCRSSISKDDMKKPEEEEEDPEVKALAERIKNTIFDM